MTINLAVVGLGYWGPNLSRNIAAVQTARLSALCDLNEAVLSSQARCYPGTLASTSFDAICADPTIDAIAIATPVTTHFEIARQALDAGKHVLVEKPLAASSEEAASLCEVAERKGLVLMVDHVFLYSGAVRQLADLCRKGDLGTPLFVDSVRINLGLVQQDISVVWDLAPHDVSIIGHLLGREPRAVLAVASSSGETGLATAAHLHLDYGEGLLASVNVSWLSPVKIRHLLVGGSRRSALYNDLDQSEPLKIYDRGVDVAFDAEDKRQMLISYRSGDVLSPRVGREEPLRNVITHFVECIATGATPLSGGKEGLSLVRVLEAADASLDKGGVFVEVAHG